VIVAAEHLAVSPADYGSLVWADDDTLVLDWNPPALADGRNQGRRLVALDLEDTAHRELAHEVSNADCDFIEESAPARLVDGRIAFLRHCIVYDAPSEPTEIAAIDLESGRQERLAALGDPWVGEGWRAGINHFSFRPGTAEGVVGFGSRICDGIAWLAVAGVNPIDFPLSNPPGANLADIWTLDCAEAVNAREPTWSPDGTRIALLIAPEARGRGDWDRMDAPYDLDLVDPIAGTLTRLATGLFDGLQLAWSPDGTTIAVITGTERVVGTVTWLIPATGGTPRRLALDHDASLSAVAWSPDGTRLAGLIDRTDLDTLDFRFQPVVIPLPNEHHGTGASQAPARLDGRTMP
jgi:hypothetical protein